MILYPEKSDSVQASTEPITLHFPDYIHVAGMTLKGSVVLNVALAQEQRTESVHVKLRGYQRVWIQRGQTSFIQRVTLLKLDQEIWSPGVAYPAASSHTLSLPFSFQLPDDLPPSFHFSPFGRRGVISYSIEIVGKRAGLQRNRRIGRIVPIIPSASHPQAEATRLLTGGWSDQSWKKINVESNIRQGLWSSYSRVEVMLEIPDLPSLPIAVAIPFHLRITTSTKSMKQDEFDKLVADGKEIFPAPPKDTSTITIRLDRRVNLKANYVARDRTRIEGPNLIPQDSIAYTFSIDKPEWIPETNKKGEEVGVWRRSVYLRSSLRFSGVPSFASKLINCEHLLHVHIPFPGIGNDFKHDLPIHVNSGIEGVAPSIDDATSVPPPFSVAVMDLPPSYWEGEDHEWEGEEKKK